MSAINLFGGRNLFDHPDLVAAHRIPLDAKSVRSIAATVEEYPAHRLEVEGSFLFVLEVTA